MILLKSTLQSVKFHMIQVVEKLKYNSLLIYQFPREHTVIEGLAVQK